MHGAKLERLAAGWLPSPKDLSAWRELRVFNTDSGGMAVNAYLVWDEVSREAALFDTGWEAAPLLEAVKAEHLQLRHIFITHSHHDHVAALGVIRAAYPKTRVHCNTKSAPLDQRNKPSEIVHLGGLRVTHRDTPGHAEDGVTYLVGNWQEDAPHVALVGDAIFAGSMGGAAGHGAQAKQAIREQILSLPEDTLLCPGHDSAARAPAAAGGTVIRITLGSRKLSNSPASTKKMSSTARTKATIALEELSA